ncbi:MAG: hypothetical protein LBS01_07235 [Prevotellaceae bacterium]|jgi:hypothetical protein|nr:hypothetical protein [Prevotellaceae bacterium]
METQVTEKNTKAEILKAYELLLKNVQQAKSDMPKTVQEENVKKEKLAKVSDTTGEGIVKNITELKTNLNVSLDDMLLKMSSEFKKLEDIRTAIEIEKKTLEDLYSLSAQTDSLAAMLLANKEKRETFEHETATQREQWEIEKARQKADEKEYQEDLAKKRKREEDEYQYSLKIKRQKEQDEYNEKKQRVEKELAEKKTQFEKDIATREQELKNGESELKELRKANAEFPAKMETALNIKEAEITDKLQTQYNFEAKLLKSQNDADLRLKDQTVKLLEEKIKELQTLLKEYADKATRAEAGVKEIAVKAIEGASKTKVFVKTEKEEE